ncbi:hypothetical protein OOK36_54910 [Streptomyces sp. NBC_00365]|uniref:hypothetical protein n=1 Tax=Streptomyces sp. NBC_00365 TaxID=2975726 RepID=UPI0022599987|nr:hypothetical protein [Streptomyces sp. NBC_00365]MCX5097558.1 hypothetical protein [Streptomyces sp. NBC_00365]
MDLGVIGRATGLIAVTNADGLLVLALYFAQGAGHCGAAFCPTPVLVPVFALVGSDGLTVYAAVFLVLVAAWHFAGRFEGGAFGL